MRTSRDGGSGAVWVLCCCAVVWTVGLAVLTIGTSVMARHRAAAAADLGALAAAEAMLTGSVEICRSAKTVVTAHGARLTACVVEPDELGGQSVRVIAEVSLLGGRLRLPPARAQAKAGEGTRPRDLP